MDRGLRGDGCPVANREAQRMASLKQLRQNVNMCSTHAQLELERCRALWHGKPGETLRAASLVAGSFGAGLLVGGGGAPANAIWQRMVSSVPIILQELLDAQPTSMADSDKT